MVGLLPVIDAFNTIQNWKWAMKLPLIPCRNLPSTYLVKLRPWTVLYLDPLVIEQQTRGGGGSLVNLDQH